MNRGRVKRELLFLLKIFVIMVCVIYIAEHYFFEMQPYEVSPLFALAFLTLVIINWRTKAFQIKDYFKLSHIPLIVVLLFLVIHFRAGIYWALNTFPLSDANTVLLTLQEPFDDFAFSMVRQYLSESISQALVITIILSGVIYAALNSIKKRLLAIGLYFFATIALLVSDIPIFDYIHLLNDEPEKNATYSFFFC